VAMIQQTQRTAEENEEKIELNLQRRAPN